MDFSANNLDAREINDIIRDNSDSEIIIRDMIGQRYLGAGSSGKAITVFGTLGNAAGAYLNGSEIVVFGNCQDAVGDTMNSGKIVVHGNAGDALGYAIRGGKIYVRGTVGYRAGIHMKAYKDKKPVLIIGETAGRFLGEYQAGGIIAVLNLGEKGGDISKEFTATGMHGGKIFLRTSETVSLGNNLIVREAGEEDLTELFPYLKEYQQEFSLDIDLTKERYMVIVPDTSNPYKQLYANYFN